MPFHIVRNDITKMRVDAVVNAANETLLGGGGVDGAIHRAAGPKLLEACRRLGGCPTGEARLTRGFDLPAKWIIHTVGPIWQGGGRGEEDLLRACYDNALALAKAKRCKSLAFPLISSGAYGYPRDEALAVATDRIRAFLKQNEMEVFLVVFDEKSFQLSRGLAQEIREYIDGAYAAAHDDRSNRRDRLAGAYRPAPAAQKEEALEVYFSTDQDAFFAAEEFNAMYFPPAAPVQAPSRKSAKKQKSSATPCALAAPVQAPFPKSAKKQKSNAMPCASAAVEPSPAKEKAPRASARQSAAAPGSSLQDALKQLDESFSQMLLRKIDEKGIADTDCYKKANVDRKLFSKIRSNANYRPSKPTAIAFAIALELPMEETKDLLMKAGFALSRSSKFDVIIEYFIEHGRYDIYEINEALFAYDQTLLGA